MFLINETDSAWMFAHGCGTTRALIKPSTREQSLREKYNRDIDQIRERQRFLNSRPSYSLPGGK